MGTMRREQLYKCGGCVRRAGYSLSASSMYIRMYLFLYKVFRNALTVERYGVSNVDAASRVLG